MIEELRLFSFGGISAELLFSKGLNVIIGETGAGKSLLLSSINFLKGEKAKFATDGTFVEAVFRLGDEEVFIRREMKGGRSRYFLNGMRVPQKIVEEKISELLAFQSQRQSIELLKPSYQLELLDFFSGTKGLLEEYKKLYSEYQKKKEELEKLMLEEQSKNREIDILRFQVEEIEAVNFSPEEEEELLKLKELVSNAEKIKAFKEFAKVSLYEGEFSVLERLGALIRELERLEHREDLLEKLNNIYYEIESVYTEIEEGFQVPEEEISLEEIESRLYEIEKLKRK
ncbi:MAG: AAA family ATPase [Desulfurobacteriaceae bacterium]